MSTGPDRFVYGSFEPVSTTPVYLMIRTSSGWNPLSIDNKDIYFPTESINRNTVLVFNLIVQQVSSANNIFLKTPDGYFLGSDDDNFLTLYTQVNQDLSFIYPAIGEPVPSDWLIQPPVSEDKYELANSIPLVGGVGYNIHMGTFDNWTLPDIKTKTNQQIEDSANGKISFTKVSQQIYPIYLIPVSGLYDSKCQTQINDSLTFLTSGNYIPIYTNTDSCKTQSIGVPTYEECGGKNFGVCSTTEFVCSPYGQSITKCVQETDDDTGDNTKGIIIMIIIILLIVVGGILFLRSIN